MFNFKDNQDLLPANTIYLVKDWVEETTQKDGKEPSVFWKLFRGETASKPREAATHFNSEKSDIEQSMYVLNKKLTTDYAGYNGKYNRYTLKLFRNPKDPTPREIPINITGTMGVATMGSAGASLGNANYMNNPMMQMLQMMQVTKELIGGTLGDSNPQIELIKQQLQDEKIARLKLEHKYELEKVRDELSEPMTITESLLDDKEIKQAIAYSAKEFGRGIAGNLFGNKKAPLIAKSSGTPEPEPKAKKPEPKTVEAKPQTQTTPGAVSSDFDFNTVFRVMSAWNGVDKDALNLATLFANLALTDKEKYESYKSMIVKFFGYDADRDLDEQIAEQIAEAEAEAAQNEDENENE